jgi:hypothetical protein
MGQPMVVQKEIELAKKTGFPWMKWLDGQTVNMSAILTEQQQGFWMVCWWFTGWILGRLVSWFIGSILGRLVCWLLGGILERLLG